MSSSEIVPVSGKEYNVSHDGLSWVKRVFLYKNALGAYICQTHLGWSNGDLPTMCRAFAWIKPIPVVPPKMKKVIMVKKANEIMNHLLCGGGGADAGVFDGCDVGESGWDWDSHRYYHRRWQRRRLWHYADRSAFNGIFLADSNWHGIKGEA